MDDDLDMGSFSPNDSYDNDHNDVKKNKSGTVELHEVAFIDATTSHDDTEAFSEASFQTYFGPCEQLMSLQLSAYLTKQPNLQSIQDIESFSGNLIAYHRKGKKNERSMIFFAIFDCTNF